MNYEENLRKSQSYTSFYSFKESNVRQFFSFSEEALQNFLRARNLICRALVDATGSVETTRQSLKQRLGHVMRIAPVKNFRVQIDPSIKTKRTKKFLDEREIELVPDVWNVFR